MNKTLCYSLLPSQMEDPTVEVVTPIIIVEGEGGYYPTDYQWKKEHARKACDDLNQRLGITPEKEQELIAQSHRLQNQGK